RGMGWEGAAVGNRRDLGDAGQEDADGHAAVAGGVRAQYRKGISVLPRDETLNGFGTEAHGRRPVRRPPTLEGADQALHPLVVAQERVLAEDGLALRIVELQVDPVHAVVLALEVGLTDELAAQ